MKYEVFWASQKVAELDALGSHFVQSFKYQDRSPNYFRHIVYFDYLIIPNYKNKVGIVPFKVIKEFVYYNDDEETIKIRRVKKDMIKEFKKVGIPKFNYKDKS